MGAYVTQTPSRVDNLGSEPAPGRRTGTKRSHPGWVSGIARPRQNVRYGRNFAPSAPIHLWAKYSGLNDKFQHLAWPSQTSVTGGNIGHSLSSEASRRRLPDPPAVGRS